VAAAVDCLLLLLLLLRSHLALCDCLQRLDERHLALLVWQAVDVGHGLAHKRLDHLQHDDTQ
jgi:hypothetical protein